MGNPAKAHLVVPRGYRLTLPGLNRSCTGLYLANTQLEWAKTSLNNTLRCSQDLAGQFCGLPGYGPPSGSWRL
jgi:hypothetical protein